MTTIVTHEFLSKRGDQMRQRYPQNPEGFEHGHSKDSFQVNYISQIFVKKIHHEYYLQICVRLFLLFLTLGFPLISFLLHYRYITLSWHLTNHKF